MGVTVVLGENRSRLVNARPGHLGSGSLCELRQRFFNRQSQFQCLAVGLFQFGPQTLYRSSRGFVGQLLEKVRALLKPVQKLFWNPNPMISALSRQSDLNSYYVHLLHNLAVEVTKLNLEVQDLKNRNLQMQGRLELLQRREKTLESMVVFREGADPAGGGDEGKGGA